MNLITGLKKENIDALAELWQDENFQKLVAILRLNQENFGKLCLTRPNWEQVQELQRMATAFSTIIKTVEDSYNKVNRRKNK